jgi:hypothetical protein
MVRNAISTEIKDFIKLLRNNEQNCKLIMFGAPIPKQYYHLMKLKQSTVVMDFGCGFDKDGKCKGIYSSPKCCCYECAKYVGYLNLILEKDLPYYTEQFDKDLGFWRKEKGCILNRDMRSRVCVSHSCHNKNIFRDFHSVLRDMEYQIIDMDNIIINRLYLKYLNI